MQFIKGIDVDNKTINLILKLAIKKKNIYTSDSLNLCKTVKFIPSKNLFEFHMVNKVIHILFKKEFIECYTEILSTEFDVDENK